MFVGEAPGRDEDRQGTPFVGAAGKCLRYHCSEVGLDVSKVYITNVVKCRPPENRTPHTEEIEACAKHLRYELLMIRPKLVVAFGATAASFFLGEDPKNIRITKIRGTVREWSLNGTDYTTSVLFVNHPSYVLRQDRPSSEITVQFQQDLATAVGLVYADTARLPANTGRRIRKPYLPNHEFFAGWHIGPRVYLVTRVGDRRHVHIVDHEKHPYYFLIHRDDLNLKTREALGQVLKRGIVHRSRVYRVIALKADPEIPCWIRVYPTVPAHWVSKECKAGMPDDEARQYTTVSPVLAIARYFEIIGIRTFEADLDPLTRFITDNAIRIVPPKRRLYLDIETDDSNTEQQSIADQIGRKQILSYAAEDDDGFNTFVCATALSRDAERTLLQSFVDLIERYDMLFTWNGENFDYPFIWQRLREHGFKLPLYQWVWWDSLFSFKKHHFWDAEGKSGYGLDNVSKSILGEGKVERHSRIIELFTNDRKALRVYNCADVDRLRRIEAKTGYSSTDAMMSSISNCFASNVYVAKRVDGLCLMEGYSRGTHFRSKEIPDLLSIEQYVGAFVLDPVKGLHEGVSNFDFSSLYPSMFQTFNVSPDTLVPLTEINSEAPENLVRCPSFMLDGLARGGTTFLKSPMGIIPTVYQVVAAKRQHYKAEMAKAVAHSQEWYDLKRHEYAYKQLGLSIYGCLGSVYSRYYNRDVAEAVTLSAQYMIRMTMELAKRLGYSPIYGDTDSIFIQIPETDVATFLDRCHDLYRKIAEKQNCPVNTIGLKYEQRFSRIVILKKKRYFGRVTSQQGQAADATDIRGLEVRRSDGVAFARRVQQIIIDGILKENWTAAKAKDVLFRIRKKVFDLALSPDDLQVTVGLQRHPDKYKTKGPHVQIAMEMMAAGEEIYVGTKIAYIVVDGKKSPLKTVAIDKYEGVYDPFFYWGKKIYPPVQRIVNVVWPGDDWTVMGVKRTRVSRKK